MNNLWSSIQRKSVSLLNKYLTGKSIDYKQIIALIIPIFVDQTFMIMMSLLNTAMISSSGVAAVSAVSIVDSLNLFLANIFIAVATGGTVIVAQYKGNGNQEMVSKAASQAISTVTVLSIGVGAAVIIFHAPILTLLFGQAEMDVLELARIFLIGSCISYPFIALFQAVIGVLRGVSDTKACLGLSVIMNTIFLGLNIIFIMVLDMGVIGLVISLIIARILGVAAALVYLFKYNHTLFINLKDILKVNISIVRKIMLIGLPFAAEQLFFNGGKLLTQTFIVQLGTLALTVNAISASISMVFQIGGSALSIAIVTVVGQCIGRRDIEDARKFIKSFIGLSTIFFVVASAFILPLFPIIVQMFTPPPEIIPEILALTLLIAIAQPLLWSISFIMPSALRAAGDANFTSIISMLSMWLVRIVLGYVLGITLQFGLMGVWVAMVIEWSVRGFIFTWRFRGDKWYSRKLI